MNILIVDDHQLVREGIKRVLLDWQEVHEIGEAENAKRTLEQLQCGRWDFIILDLKLPDRSGIEVLQRIKKAYPKIPVLILSVYPEEQLGVRMLQAGAAGYLTKSIASNELVNAIMKIRTTGKYISPTLANQLSFDRKRKKHALLHDSLTDREFQIFQLLARGKTVGQIAAELCISVKTVSTYRHHIIEKTQLKNNSEIAQYAIRNQLIE
jgi:two-component system, NarL family, invasion response regulator UvrY